MEGRRDGQSVLQSPSLVPAQAWQRVGVKRAQLKVEEPSPSPLSHPTNLQGGWPGGHSPYERGPQGPAPTRPRKQAPACPASPALSGETALHQGLSRERQWQASLEALGG